MVAVDPLILRKLKINAEGRGGNKQVATVPTTSNKEQHSMSANSKQSKADQMATALKNEILISTLPVQKRIDEYSSNGRASKERSSGKQTTLLSKSMVEKGVNSLITNFNQQ